MFYTCCSQSPTRILVLLLCLVPYSLVAQDTVAYKPSDVHIMNPGAPLNYEGLDYGPTISADGKTLYFVSNRPGSFLSVEGAGKYSHDIWAVIKQNLEDTIFSKPFNLEPKGGLLNGSLNEGIASVSSDQKVLYFTGCNRQGGFGDCDIYAAILKRDGDTIQVTHVYNLGHNVNSEYWDSQPSISPDNKRLYFASNRPPGGENFDIWYSDYDTVGNNWKPAVRLDAPINTSGKDWSPFIAPDNHTLFFASDGYKPNLGETDFYYSVQDEKGIWSKPINLGAPINTDKTEAFLSLPATGTILYFSSKRDDVVGKQGNYDIYMIYMATVPNILGDVRTIAWHQLGSASATATIYGNGAVVRILEQEVKPAGRYCITWDGLTKSGKKATSGSYYYQVELNGKLDSSGLLIIR